MADSVLLYQGIPGITGSLQISGLTVLRLAVGDPVRLEFTAANTATLLEVYDETVSVGGVVTDQYGRVTHLLQPVGVIVGPGGLGDGQYAARTLQTTDPVSDTEAGTVVNAYVGTASQVGGLEVGDTYDPSDLSQLLTLAAAVPQGYVPPTPVTSPGHGSTTTPGGGLGAWWNGLSTAGKVAVGAAAVGVVGGLVALITALTTPAEAARRRAA